jgi:hypothetical protein
LPTNPYFYIPKRTKRLTQSNLIHEVRRIKDLTTEQGSELSFSKKFSFTDETTGKSQVKRTGTTTINRTHGIVVNELARILENKGYKIGNDGNRDLYIHYRGQINKLFEFKTSCSTQDLYSAIGQLIIYSIPIKTKIDLILVLPNKLNKLIEKRLNELGITMLYYHWIDDNPVFENTEKLF